MAEVELQVLLSVLDQIEEEGGDTFSAVVVWDEED